MEKNVTHMKCYIQDEESKTERKARDAREWVSGNLNSLGMRHYTSLVKGMVIFKCSGRPTKNFTPLKIYDAKFSIPMIFLLQQPPSLTSWDLSPKYCVNIIRSMFITQHTKKNIEWLIQQGHLTKYVRGGSHQSAEDSRP